MAGDWIKLRIGIETDPAVFAIASRLKLDRFAVVGRLSAFWGWMNQHSEDGSVTLAGNVTGNASGNVTGNAPDNATADSCGMIDTITGVSGFAEALQSVGWLIFTRAGFEIPSYDRYNRSSAKTRSANAIRQARYKEKQRAAKAAESLSQSDGNALATVTGNASVTPPVTLPVTDENASREEKRREEKSNKKKTPQSPPTGADSSPAEPTAATKQPPPVTIPPKLDTPAFRSAWAEWIDERRVKQIAPYTPRGEQTQLNKLAEFGPEIAIEAIRVSTANGWQGLFPEKIAQSRDRPATRTKGEQLDDYIFDQLNGLED